jgi:hypothetical protein
VSRAYANTEVPVERSQGAIRKLLSDYRADQFGFGEENDPDGGRWAAVSFRAQGYVVRMRVPLKVVDERAVAAKHQRSRSKSREQIEHEAREQEARRIWRVMHWNIKARLEAVDEDVETLAEAFLAHLVNPATGRTVYDELSEYGTVELPSALPQLTAGAPA